ncbi:MAG: hypothetical protein ACK48Y_11760, partial [Planctomyces sp.]
GGPQDTLNLLHYRYIQVHGLEPYRTTTKVNLSLVIKQAYPFSLKSQISLAQQPPGGAGAVENFRYNLQT